jgi:hypothetical protein
MVIHILPFLDDETVMLQAGLPMLMKSAFTLKMEINFSKIMANYPTIIWYHHSRKEYKCKSQQT